MIRKIAYISITTLIMFVCFSLYEVSATSNSGTISFNSKNDLVTTNSDYNFGIHSEVIDETRHERKINYTRTIQVTVYRKNKVIDDTKIITDKDNISYTLKAKEIKKKGAITIFAKLIDKNDQIAICKKEISVKDSNLYKQIQFISNETMQWNQFRDESILIPIAVIAKDESKNKKKIDVFKNLVITDEDLNKYSIKKSKSKSQYYISLNKQEIELGETKLFVALNNTNITYTPLEITLNAINEDVIDSLEFSTDSATIDLFETFKLVLTSNPSSSAEVTRLSWTSSNPEIVSVTSDGTIQGLSIGSSTITVKGKYASASIYIEVDNYLKSIKAEKIIHIEEGETKYIPFTLNPSTVVAEIQTISDNLALLEINEDQSIYAKQAGETFVTLSSSDISTKVKVVIIPRLKKIQIDKKQLSMYPEESESIQFKTNPENSKKYIDLSYTSSNPEIAAIDNNGNIIAVSPGDGSITISHNSISEYISVHVNEYKESLTLTQSKISINAPYDLTTLFPKDIDMSKISVSIPPESNIKIDGFILVPTQNETTVITILYNDVPSFLNVTSAIKETKTIPFTQINKMCHKENNFPVIFNVHLWTVFRK